MNMEEYSGIYRNKVEAIYAENMNRGELNDEYMHR